MKIKRGDRVKFRYKGETNGLFTKGRLYKGTVIKVDDVLVYVKAFNGNCIATPDDIFELIKPNKDCAKKSITVSDYKLFGDLCFEMAVRFRDKWTSVISGKKSKPRDYATIHGGHFISRSNWGTRHCLWNCHAITQGENYAMSRGDTKTITAYYNFLLDRYGPETVKTLHEMSEKKVKLSLDFLRSDCIKCFVWLNLYSGKKAKKEILDRISSWPKVRSDKILRVMEDLELYNKGEQNGFRKQKS